MVIADFTRRYGKEIALIAPHRTPMSYTALTLQVQRTLDTLNLLGLGSRHSLALVLPNSPELAAGILSISAGCALAPLNPSYSVAEFRFYLEDLGVAALATIPGFCQAAEEAARSLDIPLLQITPQTDQPAGTFLVETTTSLRISENSAADRSGLALLLHSSGTTARPKLVGLTHANLAASTSGVASTLRLTPEDRCLNIMPLFHVHGIVGALLSGIASGSSVYCSPGFHALRFGAWLEDSQATWYTGVPSMHQGLLGRAREIGNGRCRRLRFVRSSSAHLHTRVWKDMEAFWGCPVLNAYGMTEAAHQLASNPLPPAERKYGTTGPSTSPEIAILTEDGETQRCGTVGEVGLRGPSITSGYLAPAEANQTAFTRGWFRTGDQGFLDEDGYVTLTGRLKDVIVSGGEKISPAEVDAVLMQHPAVAQALTFGAASGLRGERVYAAVVLGGPATESDLQAFARERLASFKAPSRVLIVPEIPTGSTGKMQRAGMAKQLGIE